MTREVAIKAIQDFIGWFKEDSLIRKALEMAIQALSQEPCDEKKDCSTCKYEEYSSNYQPCRDCGTLLESYTNWEQKERELPCIYDLKNRYCPRLNEHGMLKYPLQEPCDDVISREDAINAFDEHPYVTLSYASARNIIRELPSVTQKSGKWIPVSEKLPEDEQEVQITYKINAKHHVWSAIWDELHCRFYDKKYRNYISIDYVTAWMPLPEPYESQESEDI